MKFGRNLPRNVVPEWDTAYINYKQLKKLIKSAAEEVKHGEAPDTAEFFFFLDRNLENVDRFYNHKYVDAARRLKLLEDRYGSYTAIGQVMESEEMEELTGALLELRGLLRKLSWYGDVNRRGFIKITKKLDKNVGPTQDRYLESKVDEKQFATKSELNKTMNIVNDWLSKLKDVKVRDDGSSTHSSHSLHRMNSSSMLKLPPELLEGLEYAIRSDDAARMGALLERTETYREPLTQNNTAFDLGLLQRALSARAKACIRELLGRIDTLEDRGDINKRNCLHRFIITFGRAKTQSEMQADGETGDDMDQDFKVNGARYLKPATAPTQITPMASKQEKDAVIDLQHDNKAVGVFEYLLEHFSELQRQAILSRDAYGRTTLHYAAQYGLVPLCKAILENLRAWDTSNAYDWLRAVFEQDEEGHSPLYLCVAGGHPQTTEVLLASGNMAEESSAVEIFNKQLWESSDILAAAVKANFTGIVKTLLGVAVNIDHQDDQGETALHLAARFGHTVCARLLLNEFDGPKADTEKMEKTFGWTPLHIASVDGFIEIVDSLIEAGASLDQPDTSGWTAREHAALRGHIDIAKAIADTAQISAPPEAYQQCENIVNGAHTNKSLAERKSKAQVNGVSNGVSKRPEPIKSFGHRFLENETMILVNLGSMDTRKEIEAVNLDRIPLADAHFTQLDTALSVNISATGASGQASIIDLPVQDNVNTEPIVFTASDPTKVKLFFDIVPTYAGSTEKIVGRGVALLSSIKPSIGSKRMSLQGDLTIPIIAVQNMDVIGSVHFNFLIITPFSHPNMAIREDLTYWKSVTSTMLIGHRGLGKNSASRNSLQLGENTIQSFIAAANLGASYVEFDVQLTKDHVPVIYHDFLVSETGIDAPVHTLTLEQFLHVNKGQSSQPRRAPSPQRRTNGNNKTVDKTSEPGKGRSMSLGALSNDESHMSDRMKHTRDFKEKGFKGNSRGNFIQAPFTTLEEMFKTLPESIGFNIEMKYPMLYESEEQEMDTYAVELNSFVDTVLTKVYDLGKKRNIIFSSFNPDICLLLSFKQPSIPILFLSDAGTSPVGDIRASSLQEAIRFASRWNLLGVVTAAEPLILAPRLVKVVKESGLVCVSYGTLNNDPEKVQLQVKEGIDAVIVDSVLAIRKGLTGSETAAVVAP
ncbi:uncharacterized protein KY384_007903 [Bacidia gigantensis]|uniref:uncharacterized protein n=1 Tax=Bacidia gigantensis TaxID=2732470 RepID=UPI001D05164D|nr:uncharacterized protein KY384_007903 [Bacidia gigantensis]KAG8527749.1 hypothetical protein KY384_007903 [Bacidia gigantensis]